MSIRQKTFLFIFVVFIVFCLGMWGLSRSVMMEGYLDLEKRDMQQHLSRVHKSVMTYKEALDTIVYDWAAWDDAYGFVKTKASAFIEANLVDETFNETGLRLNFMIFLDINQEVVYQKGYDWKEKKETIVPQGIFGHFTKAGLTRERPVKGFLLLPEGLFLVASQPILTSKETGPANGQLLMGRRFDDSELKRLGEQLELDLSMHAINDEALPNTVMDAYASVISDSLNWIAPIDEKTVVGVTALRDIYGKPAVFIQIKSDRDIYLWGLESTNSVLAAVILLGVLLTVVLVFALNRYVLVPLKNMRSDLQKIEGLRDLSLRVQVDQNDELGDLAQAMNAMLEKLDINEREMVRLERLSALGEMAAGINHNLNNILVGVTVSSEFLLDCVKDPKTIEYVRTINRAGKQAADLVARLQDAVLGDSDEGVLQSVNTIVRDSVEMARTRWKDEAELKGIEIRILMDLSHDIPQIRGASSGLYNIMLNLIFNAVDAMPNGGDLEIQSRRMGSGVEIRVRDTGIGMSRETQKRVFEPFFTTKIEIGTGLGLATVYNTAVRWGGRVDVSSVEGVGSVFTLWFPSVGAMSSPDEGNKVVSSPRGNVLVVDDQDVITELVSHILTSEHTVSCLTNSTQVLAMLNDLSYDVVILDLGMPNLPGDHLAEAIRLQYPEMVLVLMTGWRLDDEDPRLKLFDFVLKKPLHDRQIVKDIVAQAVNLSRERKKELNDI